MACQSHRTPISFLQEICSKKGLTPHYSVIYNAGPVHEPVYIVNCAVGENSTIAKGSSKKKAKHLASYLMIMKMFQNNDLEESQGITLRSLQLGTANVLGPNFLDGIDSPNLHQYSQEGVLEQESNPVGQLQEYCAKNMWPPPTYDIENIKNIGNGIIYKCKISLWKWSLVAEGPSKKQAKKKAASILLENIVQNKLSIPKEALESMEEESLPVLNDDDASKLKEPKVNINEVTSKLASKALNGFWNSRNERIRPVFAQIKTSDDPCEVLESVTESLKLKIFYTYAKGDQDKVHCMIQLSTKPSQVISSGPQVSMESARQAAAYRAIVYLNAFSQKVIDLDADEWYNPEFVTNI